MESGEPITNMAQADTMMAGCTALAMSPDDRLVVSCSSDGSVRVSPIDPRVLFFFATGSPLHLENLEI